MSDSGPTLLNSGATAGGLADESPGSSIGHYKLLQKIGEGGFGAVWMAEQKEPVKRRAALKIIKLGMDTRQVVARFEAERQALAMMDHPNIAKVLDAGATDTGRPYFVMELVRGIPITQYCDENNVTTEDRLKLFIQVCHAIQHAHQKGIIHRDIKPSNILVTMHDGVAVPKVIDFGIAKATQQELTDKTLFTQFQQFIGTPAYMSPEQAEMSGLDIDTRSDIYSLGVLLYELLIGKTPFDGKELMQSGLEEMRRTIREKEPVRPSTRLSSLDKAELTHAAKRRHTDAPALIHQLKGDLDWIAMKCLEKDRTRRYETANALALDVQRFLSREPVLARPPSRVYQLSKAFHRNKGAFAAAAAVTTALVLGLIGSIWQAVRATNAEREQGRQRVLAEQARANESEQRRLAELAKEQANLKTAEARRNLYAADMKAVQQHVRDGNLGAARQLLNAHLPQPGESDLRGWEWRYFFGLAQGEHLYRLEGHSQTVGAVHFSPDGRYLASLGGELHLWDWQQRKKLRSISSGIIYCRFSFDGKYLGVVNETGDLSLLDPESFQPVKQLLGSGVTAVLFSQREERAIVNTSQGAVLAWDYQKDEQVKILDEVSHIGLSNSGSKLCGHQNGKLVVWDLDNRAIIASSVPPENGGILNFGFLPGDRAILMSAFEVAPMIFSLDDHQWSRPFSEDEEGVNQFATSAAQGLIAMSSYKHSVSLWRVDGFRRLARLHGHGDEVWSVAISPDGRFIASGGQDRTILIWSADSGQTANQIHDAFERSGDPVFSNDGRLVLRLNGNRLGIYDLATARRTRVLTEGGFPLRFEGPQLMTLTPQHIRYWDIGMGTSVKATPINFTASPSGWWIDASRNLLAAADTNGVLHVVRFADGLKLMTIGDRMDEVALSPDERLLATARNEIQVWDIAAKRVLHNLVGHTRPVSELAFSSDSKRLVSWSIDTTIRIWNVETGTLVQVLRGHKRGTFGGGFSTDERTLVSVNHDRTAKIWNFETGRELATFELPFAAVQAGFSPDGRYLVARAGNRNGACQIWRAPSFAEIEAVR